MNFSKSKYTTVWQCPKALWMKKYMPEEAVISEDTQKRMAAGNVVGDLAMGLFGDFVEVTEYTDDKIDLTKMLKRTQEELAKGTEIICEASFEYNGLYCAVDILKKEGDGYAIYEVKSSTFSKDDEEKDPKAVYAADVAYQKYVLEHCGIKVTGTNLVLLNKDYIRQGDLELDKLFLVVDIASEVQDQALIVEPNLKRAEAILDLEAEPAIDLDMHCHKPYHCAFWQYCSKGLPEHSVFDMYRMNFKNKIEFYKAGIIDYKALANSGKIDNKIRLMQLDHILNDKKDATIDKTIVKKFLDTLSYPLYFLDFETMQPVLPEFDGTHPYQQIPFQYSLHYIEKEGGELKHKEFLGVSGTNPMRELAEQLVADIPYNVCTMAYNKVFECSRIKEMADAFPDLADHLLNIEAHIVDLIEPFRKGGYYETAMDGSFSIKKVLPALFPDDPELDYHNLEGVHNGSEAMTIFPLIKDMSLEDQKKTRENLLKYCGLDTYAMVKIWWKLLEAAK